MNDNNKSNNNLNAKLERIGSKNYILYDNDCLIKIFTVNREMSVSYLIKTMLEIINRWHEVEIHVLMKGDDRQEWEEQNENIKK